MVKDNKLSKHAYINSQNPTPPFCQIINKGVKTNQTITIYATYIHEEERRKVSSPCIHALHEEGITKP